MKSSRAARACLLLALGAVLSAGCRAGPAPGGQQVTATSGLVPIALATPAVPAATASPAPSATLPPSIAATAVPSPAPSPTPSPTATPSPSPSPSPLSGGSLLAFDSDREGNDEIYALDTVSGELINLTWHPADDRAPAWRPDGGAVAFQSHRDGNWDIYVVDLTTGDLARLTDDPAYDGAPAWSPDGRQIAFESYRDGNLEIYGVAIDRPGGPRRLTNDGAGDYGPAWSPDGASIAFTSWRDGNKEVYVVSAAGGEPRNLTQDPADDEDPAWQPDGAGLAFVSWRDVDAKSGSRNAEIYAVPAGGGEATPLTRNPWPDLDPTWNAEGRLVWAAYEPGPRFETYDPYRPGAYHLFQAGDEGPEPVAAGKGDGRRPAPAPLRVAALTRLAALLPPWVPTATPTLPAAGPNGLWQVVEVPSVLTLDYPILVNEQVAPSLVGWQQSVIAACGHDLLGHTLGSWRPIESLGDKRFAHDYAYLSWHKTGRALDVALEFKVDGVDQMLVAREDLGEGLYWRMYLRTARQDGSQGEPLKDNPWRFWWQIVEADEPDAYRAGGKRLPIPAGYYVDITEIAARYGWSRIATYALEGDYDWHRHSRGTEYWHYERTDGLTWWEAMCQIYAPATLGQYFGWSAALAQNQSEEMLRSKGLPRP